MPSALRAVITPAQPEASAKAPWTRTTVGAPVAAGVAWAMGTPCGTETNDRCVLAAAPSRWSPTVDRAVIVPALTARRTTVRRDDRDVRARNAPDRADSGITHPFV